MARTSFAICNVDRLIYFMRWLNIITVILLVPMMIKSLRILIQTHSFVAVRMDAYYDEAASYFFTYFLKTIPVASMYALVIVWMFLFVYLKQRNFKILLRVFFNVLVVTFISSGRYIILYMMISYVFSFIYLRTNKINVKKLKYIYVIAPLGLLVLITALRGGSFITQALNYSCGSLSFLDFLLESPNISALNDRMHGLFTFDFIFELIILVLKVLGSNELKVPSYYFNIVCQNFYNIGKYNTVWFNNNTTILYYFIRDFGYVGIPIGALLFSSVITKAEKKTTRNKNMTATFLLMYFTIVLLLSIMTYACFSFTGTVVILFLAFFGKIAKKEETFDAYER